MLMMICLTTSVGALRLFEISTSSTTLPVEFNSLDQSLVDSHLESIPGFGSFTTRGLSGGNLEGLGWETDGAFDAEVLGLGTLDKFLADLLEGGNFSAGQGDTDFVSFLRAQVSVSPKEFATGKEHALGLRRTPFLAFGRTFCMELSFTTRTVVTAK